MSGAAEGWGAGDLAVCVEYGPWFAQNAAAANLGPDHDQIVRVGIVFPVMEFPRSPDVGLEFDEFPDNIFPASAFRRIEPDHSVADDASTVALIKRACVRASI